ncbi:hypothetical protein BDZ97DRAFT_1200246 [Flammula alnicola]|nr:hypothetical protein BDZ97DRAFT_1200246 [Flammula alnicola]
MQISGPAVACAILITVRLEYACRTLPRNPPGNLCALWYFTAMEVSNMDYLRILMALAILKHKRGSETCFSYILDLRSVFPLSLATASKSESLWRDHALNMEKNYAALRMSLEDKEIHSFISGNKTQLQCPLPRESTSPARNAEKPRRPNSPSELAKKKGKKKSAPEGSDGQTYIGHIPSNLKDISDKLYRGLPSPEEEGKLFVTLDIFFGLASLLNRADFPMNAFLSTTRRAIDQVSVSFDLIIKTNATFDLLGTLDIVLRLIIEKSLPVAISSSAGSISPGSLRHFGCLLDKLLTCVLIPVIRSFFRLSLRMLNCLSTSHATDSNHFEQEIIDGRPGVLALFRNVLSYIHLPVSSQTRDALVQELGGPTFQDGDYALELSSMRQSLILEAIRHLDQILTEHAASVTNSKPTRHGRMMRLVIKDTLWYICSALHIIMGFQLEGESTLGNNINAAQSDEGHTRHLGLLNRVIKNHLLSLLIRQERRYDDAAPITTLGRISTVGPLDGHLLANGSPCSPLEDSRYMRPCERSRAPLTREGYEQDKATASTNVLLDDTERRMLLRVVERYLTVE